MLQGNGSIADLHGWQWQAIMDNMGALKAMGFTAIQISPHTATCSGAFGGQGYDPSDFTSFYSGFGDGNTLYNLIQSAHYNGIQIYADMIFNHMCTHPDYSYPNFSWNDFHHYGSIQDFNDQWDDENQDLEGLNDLSQESDYVRGQLWNYMVNTNNMGFDGYRLDAAKHVPQWYWSQNITNNTAAWGKYTYGEVDDGSIDYLQGYVNSGMAVTDYALYYQLGNAFCYGCNLSSISGQGFAMANGSAAQTFVENRDVGAPTNRMLAYAFLAGYPGYPSFFNVQLGDQDTTNLVWVHNHLAFGDYNQVYGDQNTLIFERGNNLLAALNSNGFWANIWVWTPWQNTQLHDYTGHAGNIWTNADGWVSVPIPPVGYTMYAPGY